MEVSAHFVDVFIDFGHIIEEFWVQERLREKLRQQGSGARKALRSSKRQQELMSFAPCHAGLPKLFTAKETL